MRVDELTKDEFFSVAKELKPDITQEEYDMMWEGFIVAREEHYRKKELN